MTAIRSWGGCCLLSSSRWPHSSLPLEGARSSTGPPNASSCPVVPHHAASLAHVPMAALQGHDPRAPHAQSPFSVSSPTLLILHSHMLPGHTRAVPGSGSGVLRTGVTCCTQTCPPLPPWALISLCLFFLQVLFWIFIALPFHQPLMGSSLLDF